jgi:hypothetical protein
VSDAVLSIHNRKTRLSVEDTSTSNNILLSSFQLNRQSTASRPFDLDKIPHEKSLTSRRYEDR